jgi:tetratricopeptide (TPR) repeat protein
MDVALAYWYDRIHDYREIYEMVNRVGAILTDYEGDLAPEPQDYFAARSMLVAETVLSAANESAFRDIVIRFHHQASPSRICNYHVFKRYAYDSGKIGKVFKTWQEGQAFYEHIYEIDPSPYALQQEALFLSARGKYAEAFQTIERALGAASDSNWAIKNSHAIIMFRANINFADDPIARGALDRSMEILRKCYTSDRRKAFHATTFADNALKYWQQYHDDIARSYLEHAKAWLEEQGTKEPWLKKIPPLLRAVKRCLQ